MKKKYLFVTSSRADYSPSKNLIKLLKKKIRNFKLLVTGSHLNKKFGSSINEILSDGIKPDYRINVLSNNNINNVNKISEETFKKFNNFLQKKYKPDILIVLGDRFEMLPIVYSAFLKKIQVVHINGGEITSGSIDDSIRHSITKLSNYHVVSTKKNKNRLISLGEDPKTIMNFGYLGLENIKKLKLFSRNELIQKLKINFNQKNLIFVFHPETFESKKKNLKSVKIILRTLKSIKNLNLFITASNFDIGGFEINNLLQTEAKKNKNFYFFKSLGKEYFFSLLKISDGIIGNSSSGIIEVPSFKKATINLGIRQEGRSNNKTIINSQISKKQILSAINKIYSKKYKTILKTSKNEYEQTNTSRKIFKFLTKINYKGSNQKIFYE